MCGKTVVKSNVWGKRFISAYSSTAQFTTDETENRNSFIMERDVETRPSHRGHKGVLVISLLFFTCLDCFLVSPRIIRTGIGQLTVIWTLLHKSLISKMHLRLSLWVYILYWSFPFYVTWICHNSSWHKLVSTCYPFLHFIFNFF